MDVLAIVLLSIVALFVGAFFSIKKPSEDSSPEQRSKKRIEKNVSKYIPIMSISEYDDYEKSILNGCDHLWLNENRLFSLDSRLKSHQEKENTLQNVASLNNKGIALEKASKIDEAISVYEKNIKSNYPAAHSYDRLMILYKKDKRYFDELRVIKSALQVFKNDTKYQDRLTKTLERIKKDPR
jgi:tetratricopeptide (TPR) repeat protein